jgi:cytosine permease
MTYCPIPGNNLSRWQFHVREVLCILQTLHLRISANAGLQVAVFRGGLVPSHGLFFRRALMASLPNYVAAAQPVPLQNRAAWFKTTAQTYAGIMLWFVFWQDVPVGSGITAEMGQYSTFAGGILSHGVLVAFVGLILAALLCHFLFYLVPGLLGMQTGLPLYIVGTSTYGVQGGLLMPGFLMGLLQFGWLGVNAFFAGLLLCAPFGYGALTLPHAAVSTVWAVAAAFMGLKGIKYVARVATFLPLIPLAILVVLGIATIGGLGSFEPQSVIDAGLKVQVPVEGADAIVAKPPLESWAIIALICTYIVGFFATAGAAGADFGMNNRDAKDVQLGGLVGIALATLFAGGLAILIVAGAHGAGQASDAAVLRATSLMDGIVGQKTSAVFMYLLAIAAFPPACFSSFIAANSFKTTLPKVNPFISVGIGTAVSILLAVTGWAGDVTWVFGLIGASFGPVCGAMVADYLLAGRKWAGPRAGFNLAGWISWIVGFIVGANLIPGVSLAAYCPPVLAFVVGFVLYLALAKGGLESAKLPMPAVAGK